MEENQPTSTGAANGCHHDSQKVPVTEFDWITCIETINNNITQATGEDKNATNQIEAAPDHLFWHIEASLNGGVREGKCRSVLLRQRGDRTGLHAIMKVPI